MKIVDKLILFTMAAVFLFSSLDKIFHYEGFVNALQNYMLIPSGFGSSLAMPVILIELLIGIGLLIKPWRSSAALLATAMLLLFTLALSVNHLYGGRGICGCWFTITLAQSTELHLLQNLMMSALSLSIWWEARRSPSTDSPLGDIASEAAS